ncbi:hypothetical protein T484DRAFT_1925142 [Baffinella frigidus]|nr:hypothetical protein T484DRAFT_1925142 [Cryptophyta sp. CCMP2293]
MKVHAIHDLCSIRALISSAYLLILTLISSVYLHSHDPRLLQHTCTRVFRSVSCTSFPVCGWR